MNKTYPIRVERSIPQFYNIVEWMIGNTCNYSCSFCPPEFKSGSKKFLDIEVYKNTINKLIKESNKKFWFKVTGGEPTLYPKLGELLTYIKETKNYTYLLSNGSRTLRYWNELRQNNCLDYVSLTYHPEQTDNYNHIIDVVNIFSDSPTIVTVHITCLKTHFSQAVHSFEEIKNRSSALVNLQQINDDIGIEKYSESEKKILLNSSLVASESFFKKPKSTIPKLFQYRTGDLIYTYNDGSKIKDNVINFIKKGENEFFDWSCDAGKDILRIDYTTIQRAVCGEGERWSIYDNQLIPNTSIICKKERCDCALDLNIPKEKVKIQDK